MMRLPPFRYLAPSSVDEAAAVLAAEGPDAMLLAGGTDLLPNMKRHHQQPRVLVSLRGVESMRAVARDDGELVLGAGVTLADLSADGGLRSEQAALSRAAAQVATPLIRSQATLGGNLCLDTRCSYYNQNQEWRQAIDFCMKAPRATGGVYRASEFVGGREIEERDGEAAGSICWVAPGSPRCWAVSSSDTAPALIALGAEVELVSTEGCRRISLADLYHGDGMAYLNRRPGEILTRVFVPSESGWCSTYWKLRRRGSFDFPVLGLALALKRDDSGVVRDARLVVGGVASSPLVVGVTDLLVGGRLEDDAIEAVAEVVLKATRPMDNTDMQVRWRRSVTPSFVRGALRELRGDDLGGLGPLARHARRELALPVRRD